MSRQQARNWQLTINKAVLGHYEDIKEYLVEELKSNYFLSVIEENEKENLHMHIFVQYPRCVRVSYRKCYGAHVKVCAGTAEQNYDYLTKMYRLYKLDTIVDEIGKMRTRTQGKEISALELKELPLEEVKATEYNVWCNLQGRDSMCMTDIYKPDVEVWYFYGESGSGKSKAVFDKIVNELGNPKIDYVKFDGNFWQGVNDVNMPEICVYDEFRDSHMKVSEFLHFIDYYCHILNVKYKTGVRNKYKKIFITSIQSPHEIYKNVADETRQQWLRRIHHKVEVFKFN